MHNYSRTSSCVQMARLKIGKLFLTGGSQELVSHSFTSKKSRTLLRLTRTPMKNFPWPFQSPSMFKYKEIMAFTYNIHSAVHCRKFTMKQKIHQHSTLYLSKQQSTQTGCYTIAACFPFKRLEKCMTFKNIFPGLSRTKVIFQDPPFSRKNPALSRRRGNSAIS